jgi:hypothetical protein
MSPAKDEAWMKSPEPSVEKKRSLDEAIATIPGGATNVYPLGTVAAVLLTCFYLLVFLMVALVGSAFLPLRRNGELKLLLQQDIVFVSVQFPWSRKLLGLPDIFHTASGENGDLIATAFFAISLGFISLGMLVVDRSF